MVEKYRFLPAIVLVVLAEYISSTILVLYYYHSIYKKIFRNDENINTSFWRSLRDKDLYFTYFGYNDSRFDQVCKSCWDSKSPIFTYFLLCFRFICFLFYFGVGCVTDYVESKGQNWFYFTVWNVDLISIYYFLATLSSLKWVFSTTNSTCKFRNESDVETNERRNLRKVASSNISLTIVVKILFEVCLATAMFVSTVDFLLLSSNLDFWNVVEHLTTSCSLLTEMSLNSIPVRWEHIWINLSWTCLYVMFAMVIVPTGIINDWPYDFMRLDSSACFIWYTVLFIMSILFYGVLIVLQLGKQRVLKHFGIQVCENDDNEDADHPSNEFTDPNLFRSSESIAILDRTL